MAGVSVPHTALGSLVRGDALVGAEGNWALRCCARGGSTPGGIPAADRRCAGEGDGKTPAVLVQTSLSPPGWRLRRPWGCRGCRADRGGCL